METHDQLNECQKVIVRVDAELAELIPAFLENRGADIQLMHKALKIGDYEIIERTGHGMKGAGSGFGFDAVTEIGTRIETAAKGKDWEGIQKAVNELGTYLQRLEVVYE